MSKSNALETDLLELFFNGTAIPDIAENDVTSPATNLYLSLHTADPGEAGNQTTNETVYTSYARVAVVRSGVGWVIAGNSASPAANVDFPMCTGLTATITHFGIGTGISGVGYLMYSGTVTPSIAVSTGVTPRLTPVSTVTED